LTVGLPSGNIGINVFIERASMNPLVIYRLASYYVEGGMSWKAALREAFRNNQLSRKYK
jgi:hypothetical protein